MQFIYKHDVKKKFTLSSRDDALAKEMIEKHAIKQSGEQTMTNLDFETQAQHGFLLIKK